MAAEAVQTEVSSLGKDRSRRLRMRLVRDSNPDSDRLPPFSASDSQLRTQERVKPG